MTGTFDSDTSICIISPSLPRWWTSWPFSTVAETLGSIAACHHRWKSNNKSSLINNIERHLRPVLRHPEKDDGSEAFDLIHRHHSCYSSDQTWGSSGPNYLKDFYSVAILWMKVIFCWVFARCRLVVRLITSVNIPSLWSMEDQRAKLWHRKVLKTYPQF